jgi:hypothetical protein
VAVAAEGVVMLGRVGNVLIGGILFAAGAYTLLLQFTSAEPMRGFILAMGGALLIIGGAALIAGLRPRR